MRQTDTALVRFVFVPWFAAEDWIKEGSPIASRVWWPIAALVTWAAASAVAFRLSGSVLALMTTATGVITLAIGMLAKHTRCWEGCSSASRGG